MQRESMQDKIDRMTKEYQHDHLAVNKLLCENFPLRNERFGDRKAKIQYEIVMRKHCLDRLEQQAKPLREEITSLEKDLAKVIQDHENFEDHQLYTDFPLSVLPLFTKDPQAEIKYLQEELASHDAMIASIRKRIGLLKEKKP